jgi:NitT/TauT family transport system substrate-binding protein
MAGPAPAPKTKLDLIPIKFGYASRTSIYWHMYVGLDQGFYAQEGIDLQPTVAPSFPAVAQGLIANAYDIGSLSADAGLPAIHQGGDLRYVGSEMHVQPLAIMAAPEIKSFADIKNGKLIGVGSVRGGTSEMVRVVFRANNLQEGTDYSMITSGNSSARIAALQQGAIHVTPTGQPADFQLREEGFTLLGLVSDYLKEYAFVEVWVKGEWARANEEAVVRMLRANTRAIDWLYDPRNKEAAIQILSRETQLDEKYARQTYELLIEQLKSFTPKGEPDLKSLEGTLKVMQEGGDLTDWKGSMDNVLDKSYWQKAQDSLRART